LPVNPEVNCAGHPNTYNFLIIIKTTNANNTTRGPGALLEMTLKFDPRTQRHTRMFIAHIAHEPGYSSHCPVTVHLCTSLKTKNYSMQLHARRGAKCSRQ